MTQTADGGIFSGKRGRKVIELLLAASHDGSIHGRFGVENHPEDVWLGQRPRA